MVITTLKDTQRAIHRLYQRAKTLRHPYLVFDTETEAIPPYPKQDALTIGRARVTFWSFCLQGEAYSFPTHNYDPAAGYPDARESLQLLEPVFEDNSVTLVAHNWNYDGNIVWYQSDLPVKTRIWCTQIGAWAAAEFMETSLKDRAPILGRFLRATSTVDFTDLQDTRLYAEQDVLATEELYLLQRYGSFTRKPRIQYLDGHFEENPVYAPTAAAHADPSQQLSPFMRHWYSLLELPVLHATMRAERRGVPFDVQKMQQAIRPKVLAAVTIALNRLFQIAGVRFNPNSGPQLAAILTRLGIEYPYRTTKGAPSFREDLVESMRDDHPLFAAIIDYKKLVKMATTYVGGDDEKGLVRWVNSETGRVHCTIGTVNAVTGRSSASRPNLQQIPARKDVFGIRSCFTGCPTSLNLVPRYRAKWSVGIWDYGQLELRVMNLYARDPMMTKVLGDPKGDIHNTTAQRFNLDRTPAKNVNFLLLFGGQHRLLAKELTRFGTPTDEDTAKGYCDQYERVYGGVVEQRRAWVREHQQKGCIKLLFGRTRTLPFADFDSDYGLHRAETRLANNAVQGAGQDFLKAAIVRADPCCINPDAAILRTNLVTTKWWRAYLQDRAKAVEKLRRMLRLARAQLLLQVHDELFFQMCPTAEAEVSFAVADLMSWFHYFPAIRSYCVPLVAEGAVADDWATAKAKKGARHPVSAGFQHWEQFEELH